MSQLARNFLKSTFSTESKKEGIQSSLVDAANDDCRVLMMAVAFIEINFID